MFDLLIKIVLIGRILAEGEDAFQEGLLLIIDFVHKFMYNKIIGRLLYEETRFREEAEILWVVVRSTWR